MVEITEGPKEIEGLVALCTLCKNGLDVQRQYLIYDKPDAHRINFTLPYTAAIFFFISGLWITGCLQIDVSIQFRYGFYGMTLFLVIAAAVYILMRGSINVVSAVIPTYSTTKPVYENSDACPNCRNEINAETSFCSQCGCPVGGSEDLIKGWIRSLNEPPLKPSVMNRPFNQRLGFRPEFLTSKCPECRLLMYAYDGSCPHCFYKLNLTEQREMCERFIHISIISPTHLFLLFVMLLLGAFSVIYVALSI